MPKQEKDNRPKMIEEIQNLIKSGKGLSYEKLWEKMEMLCSQVFMQHLYIPAIAGRLPDPDWRSLHNSLLNAIERHRAPKSGRVEQQQHGVRPIIIGYELPLPEVESIEA